MTKIVESSKIFRRSLRARFGGMVIRRAPLYEAACGLRLAACIVVDMGHNVLVVDDELNIRLGSERVLRDLGFEVATAESGEQALETLDRQACHIVLLDLMMPEMGGMEVLKRIKSSYPDIIVIVITGYGTLEIADEAGRLGAYDFILKPFKPEQLRSVVCRAAEELQKERKKRNLVDEQRRNFRDMLRHQANFLANVIDASVDGIICADMNGNILVFNRGAERILGFSGEDVIGVTDLEQLFSKELAHEIMRMIQSPAKDGPGRLESFLVKIKCKDGSTVRCNLSAAIVDDNAGEEVGIVAILVDLSERLTMEERLRDARENLLQAEKLAAMGRLTSQIAHEINNPLYGILNTLELLRPLAETDPRRLKILDVALTEGRHLSELLRKMLVLSKPEQEPQQPVDVNSLLDDLLLFVERQMREQSIRLDRAFNESLPDVMASPAQLRRVFLNMLRNARDAMPAGGVLTVATVLHDDVAEVRIADTGVGIREEHRGRIFDAFFTTKGKMKGVGLGLSVAYTTIKAQGGDIRVESTLGEGATFIVTLPIKGQPVQEEIDSGA